MNILITGATGNIGTFLKKYLNKKKYNVIGLSRRSNLKYDLLKIKESEISRIILQNNIEVIIHLAGVLKPNSLEDYLLNSTAIQKWLINNECKDKKFIIVNSVSEYGIQEVNKINERSLAMASSIYGISKLAQSSMCYYYAKKFNINIKVLRLSNIICPRLPRTSIVGALIEETRKENGKIIINDYKIQRDFLDIRDFANAIDIIIKNSINKNIIYNLTSGNNISYKDLFCKYKKILDKKFLKMPLITETKNEENYFKGIYENKRFHHDYNWKPKYNIEQSLTWLLKEEKII